MKRNVKKILTAVVLMTFSFLPFSLYAQTPTTGEPINELTTVESQGSNIEMKLELGTQSPWSKKVPLNVIFTANEDADRIFIGADTPFGLTFENGFENNFPVQAGTTYAYTIYLVPEEAGIYKVTVDITNWDYGTNATSSESIDVQFDSSLITIPQTSGYMTAVLVRYVALVVVLAVFGFAIFTVSKKVIPSIKQWFQPPE